MRADAGLLPLSGVVIAKDEGDRIGRCVASLVPLCAEVIVLDSGSADDTVAVATAAGARVLQQPWLGFAAQKNAAIARVSQPWVLLLDADEWLDPDAAPALRVLFASGRVEAADAWNLLRRTHFLGVALNHGGWGRERLARLFRAGLRYAAADVHEHLALDGRRVGDVEARIEHDTARSHAEYAGKLQRYARLWARQRQFERKRAHALSAPLHAAAYWLKAMLLRGGFRDGPAAREFHRLHARYAYDKYRLLARASRHDVPPATGDA